MGDVESIINKPHVVCAFFFSFSSFFFFYFLPRTAVFIVVFKWQEHFYLFLLFLLYVLELEEAFPRLEKKWGRGEEA